MATNETVLGPIFSIEDDDVSRLWLTFFTDAEHAVTKQRGKVPNAVLDLFQENGHPIELTTKRKGYA
jgi:hypothetical protein